MNEYRKGIRFGIFLGILIGMTLVGVAWAAQGLVLVNGNGTAVGTTDNPIYIQSV